MSLPHFGKLGIRTYRIQGLGFRVEGLVVPGILGLRVWDLGLRVWDLRFGRFRLQALLSVYKVGLPCICEQSQTENVLSRHAGLRFGHLIDCSFVKGSKCNSDIGLQ